MSNTIEIVLSKIPKALDGWVIHKVGMIDRYRPTRMLCIDIQNNKIDMLTEHDGYSHGYCDGGTINGNKVAFFGSYNGITYYLDYYADKFQHEELLSTKERRKEGISRGIRDIKFIGKHFYSGYAGNQIHRRDAPKKWTLISEEPRKYCKRFNKCDVQSVDGFNEEEIYFCGNDGNLWVMLKDEWHKIRTKPDWNLENVICGDDGKVYAVDTRGRVAIGRGTKFELFDIPKADDIMPYIHEACVFQGKLYGGGVGGSLMVFKDKVWQNANLPLIGSVEYMVAKDGVMLIAGAWTLKVYNGKETVELYGVCGRCTRKYREVA